MKSLLFVAVILAMNGACIEEDGLHVTVKNSIPDAAITSVKVCPLPLETLNSMGSMNPLESTANFAKFTGFLFSSYQQGLCLDLGGNVENGQKQSFYVTPDKLESLYNDGNGYLFFLFNDSAQSSSMPGPCWQMPNLIHGNFKQKQAVEMDITAAHMLSYSCVTHLT